MNIPLVLAFFVALAGVYGLIYSRHLVKSVIFLNVIQTAVVLIFVMLSRRSGTGLPILGTGTEPMIDPLPQALMITAIVIGAATTALALMMSVKIFHFYGSLQWRDVFERED